MITVRFQTEGHVSTYAAFYFAQWYLLGRAVGVAENNTVVDKGCFWQSSLVSEKNACGPIDKSSMSYLAKSFI